MAGVLALLTAAPMVPARATEPPVLSANQRLLLAETFRVAGELGEAIWPGWGVAPWEVLLVAGEHEYLINSPRRPESFSEIERIEALEGVVLARSRSLPPGLRATFPLLGGPPLVVVGTPEATGLGPTAWMTMVLHEHFHQLQMSDSAYYADVEALDLSAGDETGNWMLEHPFAYDDPVVQERFRRLGGALRAAIVGEAPASTVGPALAALGSVLSVPDRRYLAFQLWQEGVARYVQYRAARVAGERFSPSAVLISLPGYQPFAEHAVELRAEILQSLAEPQLAEHRRVAFYAVGAGLAMLLDETTAGWQATYLKRKFALEELLP